jgi:hypothetical protein
MKDLIVIMGSSCERGFQSQYISQLMAAGIDVYVETLRDMPNSPTGRSGGTLGYQVLVQRKLIELFSDYEKVIITDAWDVLFYGSKEDVIKKIPDDHILLAAERHCWPDGHLALSFKGVTPWRYVNGGMSTGTSINFSKWLDALERHPRYNANEINQKIFNCLLLDGDPLIHIDEQTELFYCAFGEHGELDFESGLPVNTVLGTHPNFVHFNGETDPRPILERFK